MSYARGTQNYNLPQTQGTDKRDWSDTNAAFLAIDTAIKTANTTASSASSAASTAQSRADSAYTLASTANTAAGNAATAAATADEKAVTAKNRADAAYTKAVAAGYDTSVQYTVPNATMTWATALNNLYSLIDFSKVTIKSKLEINTSGIKLILNASQIYQSTIQLSCQNIPTAGVIWTRAIQLGGSLGNVFNFSDGTSTSDQSSSATGNGTVLKLYY